MRDAGVEPGRGDAEAHGLAPTDRVDREGAAARDRLPRDDEHVQQQLDPIFWQQHVGQIPGQLGLVILDEAARHDLRVAEVDLGAGRARRAEGEAAELQARRGRPRAPLDEVERKGLGLFVAVFLLQHFEPVDDGAGGADQIVADAGAQERGKVESVESDGYGHGGRLRGAGVWQTQKWVLEDDSDMAAVGRGDTPLPLDLPRPRTYKTKTLQDSDPTGFEPTSLESAGPRGATSLAARRRYHNVGRPVARRAHHHRLDGVSRYS